MIAMAKPKLTPTESGGIAIQCSYDQLVDLVAVVPNPKNPNRHPEKQIALLSKVIQHQGWRAPIVVSTRSGFIVAGHGRYEAAKLLGLAQVPVNFQAFESEAMEYAHMIADNRIAELANPDQDALRDLLKELDGKLDLDLSGFDPDALADLQLVVPVLEDGATTNSSTELNLADTTCSIGEYRFTIERSTFLEWQEKLRQEIGFDRPTIIVELRKRLAL